jgi:hypothetical protein
MSGVYNLLEKSPEILKAEEAGRNALIRYCGQRGAHTRLCEQTGIDKGAITRMKTGGQGISLELAIILEVATAGALTIEILCPSRAHLLEALLRARID